MLGLRRSPTIHIPVHTTSPRIPAQAQARPSSAQKYPRTSPQSPMPAQKPQQHQAILTQAGIDRHCESLMELLSSEPQNRGHAGYGNVVSHDRQIAFLRVQLVWRPFCCTLHAARRKPRHAGSKTQAAGPGPRFDGNPHGACCRLHASDCARRAALPCACLLSAFSPGLIARSWWLEARSWTADGPGFRYGRYVG